MAAQGQRVLFLNWKIHSQPKGDVWRGRRQKLRFGSALSMTSRGLHPAPALRFSSSRRDSERHAGGALLDASTARAWCADGARCPGKRAWGILDVCEAEVDGRQWAQIAAGKGFAEGARSLCIRMWAVAVAVSACLPSLSLGGALVMQTAPAIVPYLPRYHESAIEQPNTTTTTTTT